MVYLQALIEHTEILRERGIISIVMRIKPANK